jgi:phage tail-like protein
MAALRSNPYAAFNFVVSLVGDKDSLGGFMEVTGLDTENAIIEYREGDDNTSGAFVRKLPGLERYPNVILRRGITGDLKLWNKLRQPIRNADIRPEFGSATPALKVDLQDEKHETVQSWTLQNAWVSALRGPSLNGRSNEIAIESIEVVCERIELS